MNNLIKKLVPAPGYYIIEPLLAEKSSSAISIAKVKEDPLHKGIIRRVGPTYITDYGTKIFSLFTVGNTVLYSFQGFEEIQQDGEVARIIPFKAVVAVYEDDNNNAT